jgi:queuosine precursor transporter
MIYSAINSNDRYTQRREIVFILLAGLFIGTLAMLNILGITRLIDLSFTVFGIHVPFTVFVGVLPYPITFLCTDFISELYGRKRATYVVWTGFVLNIWVVLILWIGGILPPIPDISSHTGLPDPGTPGFVFFQLRRYTFSSTTASMIAYLSAQFIDVHIFHYLKNKSRGKLLWLRNNGSTLTSQLVDSLSVVLITFLFTNAIQVPEGYSTLKYLIILITSNYIFKMVAALIDTIPFYIGVRFLSKFLDVNPVAEYHVSEGNQL